LLLLARQAQLDLIASDFFANSLFSLTPRAVQ